jgi:heme exporter protein D
LGQGINFVGWRPATLKGVKMDENGAYIWVCFALTTAVLLVCEWRARLRHKRVYRDIEVRVRALGDSE